MFFETSTLMVFGLTAFLLFCAYLYKIQYSTRGMPPGPFTLPIIGNVPTIYTYKPIHPKHLLSLKSWEYFHILKKTFGGIFTVSCGKFTAVVFSDYELLREVENMDEYSIKISNELTTVRTHNRELGLIFAGTPSLWVEMRKFSQRTLRDFGFGKRHSMQSVIEAELGDLLEEFRREAVVSGVLTIRTNFNLSVLNVLWAMIAGHRYKHDDPKLVKMMEKNFAMTKASTFVDPLVLAFPMLREWFPKLFKWDLSLNVFQECHAYSRSLVEERRREGAYLQEPQNYIDCFLKKIEETKNDPNSVYTDLNLETMIEDFMQTGSTTSVGTLNYGILFMTINPEVQGRCQAEIDAIVPRNMLPTLDDIEKMPYFQATILETHRLGSVVPIPIPRIVAHKDWHYKGYVIPKDTVILSNHYSILMDEGYWKDPENFRPERFINDKGEFVPDKRVVHFGFGKRYCIGVTLSNSVIPIYIATLIQNFNFSVVPGQKTPTREPELGVSLSPKEFKCRISARQ